MDAPTPDQDRAALEAVLYHCRREGHARTRYMELTGETDPVRATEALNVAVERHGWALLLAPEIWACLQEWWACARLDHDLEVYREARDRLVEAYNKPSSLVVVEVKEAKVFQAPSGQYLGERKIGADILSTRASALAKLADSITRTEEAYARRRAGFAKSCAAYQRRLHLLRLPLEDKIAAIVRRQAYLEGELSVAAALIETSAPRDAAGIEAVMSSLQARLPDLAPR